MKKLYWFFFFLFKPSYWVMNYRYSKEWDEKINDLMNKHKFEKNHMTANLGDTKIWVVNHPYASFVPYQNTYNIRPSRKTIYLAHKKLLKDVL